MNNSFGLPQWAIRDLLRSGNARVDRGWLNSIFLSGAWRDGGMAMQKGQRFSLRLDLQCGAGLHALVFDHGIEIHIDRTSPSDVTSSVDHLRRDAPGTYSVGCIASGVAGYGAICKANKEPMNWEGAIAVAAVSWLVSVFTQPSEEDNASKMREAKESIRLNLFIMPIWPARLADYLDQLRFMFGTE